MLENFDRYAMTLCVFIFGVMAGYAWAYMALT